MNAPAEPELRQVLKGLALNRQPGWNFPGNFLELSFDEVGPDTARLTLAPGPHCMDADGQMDLGALGVLADIGMAATMRQQVGLATRMATVAMHLQLTGAPRIGPLQALGSFDGFVTGLAGQQGLARAEIRSHDQLVGIASGTFMALGNREGTAPLPMRRRGVDAEVPPLRVAELNEEERAVYARAQRALIDDGKTSFIERFWGFVPQREGDGAACDFTNGLHAGNRVGHTQGGLTFALAAYTAVTALGNEWRLVGISAWYVSPGTGPSLRSESAIVHRGSLTAVVRTRISTADGRTVLETMTQHARAAA
jgi:acyl-coenzyme A thioesterase PaaI-like protein